MLKDVKINQTEMVIEYPRFNKFKLKMRYIPRDELTSIRERSTKIGFNRATRAREDVVDTDKFMDEYIQKAISGWEGLTYNIVSTLVPIEVDNSKLEVEIPYSHEDAMWLVKNSSEFDTFISETMANVEAFSLKKKDEQLKK